MREPLAFGNEAHAQNSGIAGEGRADYILLRRSCGGNGVDGDFDLAEDSRFGVDECRTRVKEDAEHDDRHGNGSDGRDLHAGVPGEVPLNLTQKESDLAPVQGSSTPALRR